MYLQAQGKDVPEELQKSLSRVLQCTWSRALLPAAEVGQSVYGDERGTAVKNTRASAMFVLLWNWVGEGKMQQ